MKKLSTLIMGILFYALASQAQAYDTTSFYGKMNYLYSNINKTQITTGLLRDYGIDFQELNNYTGTILHDSNFTSLTDLRMLYGSLYSQQITSTASSLYLDTLNKRFSQYGVLGEPLTRGFVQVGRDGISSTIAILTNICFHLDANQSNICANFSNQ